MLQSQKSRVWVSILIVVAAFSGLISYVERVPFYYGVVLFMAIVAMGTLVGLGISGLIVWIEGGK